MMTLIQGVGASSALQSARHKVFVEGSDDEEIDPTVIDTLFKENGLTQVEVRPLGGCESVRSAASALVRHHPSYYFIVDRDDLDEGTVEASWTGFPDPSTANLLIWRKREIENYFIDPSYISQSAFIKRSCDAEKIAAYVLREANRRVFLDAANLALLHLHRRVRQPFCRHFRAIADFENEAAGRAKLCSISELARKVDEVSEELTPARVGAIYDDFIARLTGGSYPLTYSSGDWLKLMSGKEIFRAIAGRCFTVRSASRGARVSVIQGKEQSVLVAKGLLRLPIASQPEDFRKLVEMVRLRVETT